MGCVDGFDEGCEGFELGILDGWDDGCEEG